MRNAEASLEHAHRRLEHLYEISKLFVNFESIDQTFDAALGVATKTLPLLSAILIEVEDGHSRMILWPASNHNSRQMQAAKANVETAYSYLVGSTSPEALDVREEAGATVLPAQANGDRSSEADKRFIVIPLVIRTRPIFGALQLECAETLNQTDLVFVNAIANQLAIALDRDHAWEEDIKRRERAEGGRARAEQRRITAEALSEEYATLARENRELYERAQHAIGVREQILAIVSHDLRSPLGTILLTTESIVKKGVEAEPKKALEAVVRIERAARRMQRLIGDLLDFASIAAGRLAIKSHAENPGSIINETLASFDALAQAKGLRLAAAIDVGLPDVYCDRDRVLQVIANLVGNATNVTAKDGAITLSAQASGAEVAFAVADTGPGIGEQDLARLFDRYWRSGEANYRGTGLGLAIAHGIIDAHGGRIWAESRVGEGATFHFTIPAVDANHPLPGEPASPAQGDKQAQHSHH